MWIDDVVSLATIQSVWGNNVRNRLVQTFANMAEANTRLAALPTGAVCHLDDTGLMYHKYGGIWRAVFPTMVAGAIGTGQGFFITGGDTQNIFTINLPAGYRMGRFELMMHSNGNVPGAVNTDVKFTLAGGATLIGGAQWSESQVQTSHAAGATSGVNIAGEAGLVTVHNNNAPGTGDLLINGNGYYTNYWALLIP